MFLEKFLSVNHLALKVSKVLGKIAQVIRLVSDKKACIVPLHYFWQGAACAYFPRDRQKHKYQMKLRILQLILPLTLKVMHFQSKSTSNIFGDLPDIFLFYYCLGCYASPCARKKMEISRSLTFSSKM